MCETNTADGWTDMDNQNYFVAEHYCNTTVQFIPTTHHTAGKFNFFVKSQEIRKAIQFAITTQ